MKLSLDILKKQKELEELGIELPKYDVEKVIKNTKENPKWVHIGIGNIFRVFLGGIADQLLDDGCMQHGITCVETYDFDVVDEIYRPHDNLCISVILNNDGTVNKRVLGSMCETIKANIDLKDEWNRLKEVFTEPTLQLVSFTITEKGYALYDTQGEYLSYIKDEIENGPTTVRSAMGIVTAMLFERFKANKMPLTLVSMDNCSKNGQLLYNSVSDIAMNWEKRGYVPKEFVEYVKNDELITFPWTMIDKITPRPSEKIADEFEKQGLEDMHPIVTSKSTYIAPFVNAEGPQYLVMEDQFKNGRPNFEDAGVFMTDRITVNKSERMKVTVCLNPIHSALGTYGCVLGYTLFSDQMKDVSSLRFGEKVGEEGMVVVEDPKILSPKAFLEECLYDRFPNPYLGDTVQRLVTDISQGVSVRFGETIKAYVKHYGDANKLEAIPFAIAGWLRYLLAVDDMGNKFELSPDPLNDELQNELQGVEVGKPESLTTQTRKILSNSNIFGIDLYEAGIGDKIEDYFRELISDYGSVRKTLDKYYGE